MQLVVKIIVLSLVSVVSSGAVPYLVDVSALLDGSSDAATQREVKLRIDQGLRENGILVLTGHGLTSTFASDSFQSARKLFELDLAAKHAVSIRNDNTSFGRGYLGFGDESGLSTNFEPKEGYSYGNPQQSSNSGAGNLLGLPNKWPSTLPAEYINIFDKLYTEKVRVAELIVNALSECFTCADVSNIDETAAPKAADLNAMIQGGHEISLMRLFHYYHQQSPTVQQHLQALRNLQSQQSQRQHHSNAADASSIPNEPAPPATPAAPSMLGSSPHTDWGFLTLILADEVGGLQFLPKGSNMSEETNWVDVPYVPGSLVVNGGDYLKLISRGVYHSPIHRVLSPGSRRPVSPSIDKEREKGKEKEKSVSMAEDALSSITTSRASGDAKCSEANTCPDRYSFVFFFYPSYTSPVSDTVLSHCTHYSQSALHLNSESAVSEAKVETQTQEAMISTTTGESEASLPKVNKNTPAFNTLLNLEGGAGARPHLFGDYVIQKWKGVYRREDAY